MGRNKFSTIIYTILFFQFEVINFYSSLLFLVLDIPYFVRTVSWKDTKDTKEQSLILF